MKVGAVYKTSDSVFVRNRETDRHVANEHSGRRDEIEPLGLRTAEGAEYQQIEVSAELR